MQQMTEGVEAFRPEGANLATGQRFVSAPWNEGAGSFDWQWHDSAAQAESEGAKRAAALGVPFVSLLKGN